MAVAEDGHVVDHVQVAASLGGQHVFAPAALDARRIVVVVLLHGGEGLRAPAPERLAVAARRGHGLEADQRSGIGDQAQPARGVLRAHEVGHRHVGPAQPLDPHMAVGCPQRRAGCHGLTGPHRVVDAQRAAHLDGARAPVRMTVSAVAASITPSHGAFRATGAAGHRSTPVPMVDRRNRAQRRRAAHPGLAEGGDDRGRPGGDRLGGQIRLTGRVEPRPGVHRVGLERQVEARDGPRVQAQQRRVGGDRVRRVRDTERVADQRGHHLRRHRRGPLEDPPFEVR